ncbi:hypothetical protein D9756_001010 [Leucocoprinus leucothites]|uniref:Uncharacterized protein n=1 Tax=Leucocoprinus leucothites TaxID=201217 RepID=A0A8H5GEH7_9AGAR|nr:hypothetical protein D9756_001010 [Leucoagaricus leucothites]
MAVLMLALMTAQALPALRSEYTLPLTRLIYRDGVIYYVYIFLLSLINAIMIVALPSDLASILVIIEGTMHWVLACRVVLHIREQAYIQQASPLFALSTQQSNEAQLSPLEFDSPHEDAGYP